jgi:hypothetical protein
MYDTGTNICDNKQVLVIVIDIWQKLSCAEHDVALIVTYYWQLLSEIIGETLLIVRNYWRNPTFSRVFKFIHISL